MTLRFDLTFNSCFLFCNIHLKGEIEIIKTNCTVDFISLKIFQYMLALEWKTLPFKWLFIEILNYLSVDVCFISSIVNNSKTDY